MNDRPQLCLIESGPKDNPYVLGLACAKEACHGVLIVKPLNMWDLTTLIARINKSKLLEAPLR